MTGLFIESLPLDVFEQMAVDEALARSHPEAFCLRFFRWKGVGLTFGYAQRFRAVETMLPPEVGSNWTRRPTGGGIVPHLSDLTFSCVFPDVGGLDPMALYCRLHTAIHAGLCEKGIPAILTESQGDPAPHGAGGASQCFKKPVALDLVAGGRKILGGAIRRMGDTVLYQGSLQFPDARQQAPGLERIIQAQIGAEWGIQWTSAALSPAVQAQAEAFIPKYRSSDWIQRR